jgi:short-subunit dehydrogenase
MIRGSDDYAHRYGPWALIAGGGAGIGAAHARELARRGLDLILLDRDGAAASRLAAELEERHGGRCEALVLDLADPATPGRALAAIGDREIGMLVYNAAMSDVGPFYKEEGALDDELARLNVNVVNPLQLLYTLARPMLRRQRGGIILMSSGAGFQGAPYYAHYAATKAYNTVLGEGLWEEFRHDGVDVLAVSAGLTSSPGLQSARDGGAAEGQRVQTPEEVAAEAIGALGKQPLLIPGSHNRRLFLLQKLLPRRAVVQSIAKHAIVNFLGRRRPAQRLSD